MLSILAGGALVGIVMIDLVWSTLTTLGGGPVTNQVTLGVRRFTSAVYRTTSQAGVFALSGPLTLILTSLAWLAGLWTGWVLLFNGFPAAIVDASTGDPTDLSGRIYYVGFTLSTLGVGDLKPLGEFARLMTDVAAFNGLILVTLAITYAVPLVSGAVQKRQLAFSIANLGADPLEIVYRSWNGTSFKTLETRLTTLADTLLQNAEQRRAYPILDNYQSHERAGALGLQPVVLDEALSILTLGLDDPRKPDPVAVENLRDALAHYLRRIGADLGGIEVPVPEPPDLQRLADTGLSVVTAEQFGERIGLFAERRKRLHQLIVRHDWRWADVYGDTTIRARKRDVCR